MFNSRDEKLILSEEFYNPYPYKVGRYVINKKTKEIVKICNIYEEDNKKMVLVQLVQFGIRTAKIKTLSLKELKQNYIRYDEIIIERMPSEEECLHIGLPFDDVNCLKLKK